MEAALKSGLKVEEVLLSESKKKGLNNPDMHLVSSALR